MNTSIITAATTINSNNYCLFIFDFLTFGHYYFCFHKPQNAQNYNNFCVTHTQKNTTVNEREVVSITSLSLCHYLFF